MPGSDAGVEPAFLALWCKELGFEIITFLAGRDALVPELEYPAPDEEWEIAREHGRQRMERFRAQCLVIKDHTMQLWEQELSHSARTMFAQLEGAGYRSNDQALRGFVDDGSINVEVMRRIGDYFLEMCRTLRV